jgi:hypothetical protein
MSDEQEENYNDDYTMDEIVHYSSYLGGNAAGFIVPKEHIDISSHGLGSGIYGVSRLYLSKYPATPNADEIEYVFKIDNPYVISNDEECERFIAASKNVMKRLQYMVDAKKRDKSLIITEENLREIAQGFAVDIQESFDIDKVAKALSQFWTDYHNRTDMVAMPINYILETEGFDGVMSYPDTTCHSWSRGDVKFIPYPRSGHEMPVTFVRVDKHVIKI